VTEDEKRQQKALLLLDFQEAQENLAHLHERTGRIADGIGEVRRWISDAQSIQSSLNQDKIKRDTNIRTNSGSFRTVMNFDEILALMDECAAAEILLDQLAKRKADLGLK
jgi:hypothetical protein